MKDYGLYGDIVLKLIAATKDDNYIRTFIEDKQNIKFNKKENGANLSILDKLNLMKSMQSDEYKKEIIFNVNKRKELGIKRPLRVSELNKDDIRTLSKDLELPTWNKQSFACLSSRFVYGETITGEKLERVDKAEQLLLDSGFEQMRVRVHGNLARIEVLPQDINRLMEEETRDKIQQAFKEYGFDYVSVDLKGYRTGSMNETIREK